MTLASGIKCCRRGIGWQISKHFPIYKHYPYRFVGQMMKRKTRRNRASGFSESYSRFPDRDNSCFVHLLPNYKDARKFDGSFHEFELRNQGSLFRRWLRGREYITW